MNLITKDYDSCCDFGIRAEQEIIDIFSEKKIGKNLINILTEITGIQELHEKTLFTVNREILNHQYRLNFNEKIKRHYFSQKSLLKELNSYSTKQLNIKMQELKPYSPIIYGFSLSIVMAKFFYRIQNDMDYRRNIHDLIWNYGVEIDTIYRMTKNRFEKKMHEVFNVIDDRNFLSYRADIGGYNRYPYFISQLALVNRSFLRLTDKHFTLDTSERNRNFIRKTTQKILHLDKIWFMHDLLYIDMYIEKIKNNIMNKEENKHGPKRLLL